MSILPASIGSSSLQFASNVPRIAMNFTDRWGEGKIFEWYYSQRVKTATVMKLQVRIDDGKPPHRFVLAYLQDGTVYRFDRRPRTSNPGALVLETMGASHRAAADDWCEVISKDISILEKSTVCEIDMTMPPKTDLLLVISVCFALSHDSQARFYDLLKYNCYFFSWTILLVVTRHALPFNVPSPDDILETLSPKFDSLSRSITEKTVDGLLGIVCHIITAVRGEAGHAVRKGLSPLERVVWKLPTTFMGFLVQQALKLQLYLGLENAITQKVREGLTAVCRSILENVWERRTIIGQQVEQRLWIKEIVKDFEPTLRTELSIIMWDAMFDMIVATMTSVHDETSDQGREVLRHINRSSSRRSRIKSRVFGDGQMVRVWNEALKAGTAASHKAVQGQARVLFTRSAPSSPPIPLSYYTQLHGEMFDIAFEASRSASLSAAQRVVEQTQTAHRNPKRAEMWTAIWGIWDRAWFAGRDKAKEVIVRMNEAGIEETLTLVTNHLVATIGDIQSQGLRVSVHNGKSERILLSIDDFQDHVKRSINSAYAPVAHNVPSIHAAMDRVWGKSRASYQSLVNFDTPERRIEPEGCRYMLL